MIETVDTPAAGSKPYHHGNLREAMVASALALLEADGPGGLSLRRAARDIGVSQTAPLYHFGNRLGLLAAVAARGFHMLKAHRIERLASQTTPRARLRAAMLAYVEFAIAHPALFRLMTGPDIRNRTSDPALAEAAQLTFALLRDCVCAYLAELTSQDMRGGLPDEWRATQAAWAMSHGIATILLDRHDSPLMQPVRDPKTIAEGIVDLLISGLGAPPV